MASIMIVDDAADAREALGRFLEKARHTVRCAPNGREALAQVILQTPDVVILDLLMPEMDGPSFLEVVRSYLRLQNLPVILLTAVSEGPMLERARAAGVNSVLVKGTATFDDVKRAIEELIYWKSGA
jgi:CheY-like chemotaxis protein